MVLWRYGKKVNLNLSELSATTERFLLVGPEKNNLYQNNKKKTFATFLLIIHLECTGILRIINLAFEYN